MTDGSDEQSGPDERDTDQDEESYAKFWVNEDDTGQSELADVDNVKREWENLTIYLPERLREEIELSFRELSYETMRAHDRDLQKLRDFYPLLIVLGLESLESTELEDAFEILAYSAEEYEFEQ